MDFYFILKRKNIKLCDLIENTFIAEYSVILMQKNNPFDNEIASYICYKFFIENIEIKIETEQQIKEYSFYDTQNKAIVKYSIEKPDCKVEMITIFPNLEIDSSYVKNLESQTKNLNNLYKIYENNPLSKGNIKINVIFSNDLKKL
ncbi:hypothetical protein GVAV_002660 [Gurleya vavrai]